MSRSQRQKDKKDKEIQLLYNDATVATPLFVKRRGKNPTVGEAK